MTTTHIEVTPDTTPEELREAMTHLSAKAHRYGRYAPEYEGWHAELDRLSYILEERTRSMATTCGR